MGRHERFYCPLCGEVTCGMKRFGAWAVMPHYRHDAKGKSAPCRGGPVDPVKDRAP